MIRKTNFFIKQNREEHFSCDTKQTFFRCLYADSDSLIENKLPWHWHTSFEIDYVAGCDMKFDFDGSSVLIPHGGAVFINSGEIHSYYPCRQGNCKIYAILFEPVFLAGSCDNILYEKYIAPIINAEIRNLPITQESDFFQFMTEKIKKILQLCKDEPNCYEFLIRAELETIWCSIMEECKSTNVFVNSKKHDSERIKKMLDYIHTNYSEHITLQDIALSAMIGTRECNRCFQRSIGRSPMDYLNDYRIQVATLQLTTTNHNITEISESCGFSSISYFGKVFKRFTGVSPLQYRNLYRINSEKSDMLKA